ncbi:MAG TPA: esterase [Leptospiraceae bacterium]|nr:esterase [Spirochaetaceae bacterium]HBS04259.1 esterase [Leptospiraceae bacterium]|tara:strand:+ start:71012 stop:72700 length:1689 start_codon:yes stop_codon:yes gene_type:complete
MKRKTRALALVLGLLSLNYCAPEQSPDDVAAAMLLTQPSPEPRVNRETIQLAFDEQNDGSFEFEKDLWIESADGTRISANVFLPAGMQSGQKYPAIVFVNSWALNEFEYIVPAAILAKKGYIVLSYSTRGFGKSEGLINVAGPADMQDLSAALDWLEEHTPVDVNNIGMAGISYGAGISMLGLARENRVKTAVAMSGWTDLERSLYGNESPRMVWGELLLLSGGLTGRMDPVIRENFNRLLDHREVDYVRQWAAERSAKTYIDAINENRKPLYISNNMQDNLFAPNGILEFYQNLEGPRRLDINQGIHATAEIAGLLGISNFVWDNAYAWFDYWLKGEDNGIMDKNPVTIQRKFSKDRDEYSSWPPEDLETETLYLRPSGWFRAPSLDDDPNRSSGEERFYNGMDTWASTGIPLLSPILESHVSAPVKLYLPSVSDLHGEVFRSGTYWSGLKIRGVPEAKLRVRSDKTSAQFVVYLYERDLLDWGTLITHGVVTLHGLTPGAATEVLVDLNAVSYNLSPGSRLALVVDTFDAQYASPDRASFRVSLDLPSSAQSELTIPVIR